MTYCQSCKPVRIVLPEGQQMHLNRRVISQFRRENRLLSEGAFGPWKKGEARQGFVMLKALEWKMGARKESLEGLLAWQKGEWGKAESDAKIKEKKRHEAQRAFDRNSEKAMDALSGMKDALDGFAEERENLTEYVENYSEKVKEMQEQATEDGDFQNLLKTTILMTAEFATLCGQAVMESMDRLDSIVGKVERGPNNEGESGWKEMSPEMRKAKMEMLRGQLIAEIRKHGLGRKLIDSNFSVYEIANLDELEKNTRGAKEKAVFKSKHVGKTLIGDDMVPKFVRKDLKKKGSLLANDHDITAAIEIMDSLRELDRITVRSLENIQKHELSIYDGFVKLCLAVKNAKKLENALIEAHADYAIANAVSKRMQKRFMKNDMKMMRLYGRDGNVGLVQLAIGKADSIAFRAGRRGSKGGATGTARRKKNAELVGKEILAEEPQKTGVGEPRKKRKREKRQLTGDTTGYEKKKESGRQKKKKEIVVEIADGVNGQIKALPERIREQYRERIASLAQLDSHFFYNFNNKYARLRVFFDGRIVYEVNGDTRKVIGVFSPDEHNSEYKKFVDEKINGK